MFDGADPKGSKKYVIGAQAYKDKVRTFIEFENWMIQQKLLHPNFLTMKDQELFAGYADGSFPLMREQFTMPYTPISSMNPKADPKIEIKPIYPFPVNGVLNTIPKSVHYNIAYRSPWVIGKNSKVKEAVVKAQNYMYSDEGRDLSYLGIEGETFVRDPKTPSGYRLTNVQSVWTRQADGKYPDGMKTLKDMGFASWWTTGVVPAYERFALLNYKEGESDKAFTTSNEAKYMNDNGILRSPDPDLVFTREESQAIAELSTSLNTYIEEGISKFVLGTKPMAEFDDFIKGLEKFETKKLLDIYNGKLK
jgi:putative aldouronate transport system substrate-binding protein